jgi:hypothetical protein
LKEKVKNWLSNLTRVKSTTLSTSDPFHLLLSVIQAAVANCCKIPFYLIFSSIVQGQIYNQGRNQGLLALNQAGLLARYRLTSYIICHLI